jgi:hypothetical protein
MTLITIIAGTKIIIIVIIITLVTIIAGTKITTMII